MKKTFLLVLTFSTILFLQSCNNDDDNVPSKTLIQTFDVALKTSNAIPTVAGRDESGNIKMDLFSDNSLEFTITVNNLASSDALTAAHVHAGDPVTAGVVVIPLVTGTTGVAFSGSTASGTITLTSDEISTLQGSDVYVNVHSTESGPGLVRGQIDKIIDNAYNVELAAANSIPANGRSEVGNAIFRVIGSTLYYKVTIDNLDATDAITAGHIHSGASGATGGVLIDLEMTDTAQLGITKMVGLDNDQLNNINNDQVYVNLHSTQVPASIVRGQIR